MAKVKMVCPSCGSDDVTRDCLGRWSVGEQKWEVSSELDCMQCEACDREIGPDGVDEDPVEANTRAVGMAIYNFLEGRTFSIHQDDRAGEELEPVVDATVDVVDASDPNNLIVVLDGGQPSPSASSLAPEGGVMPRRHSVDQTPENLALFVARYENRHGDIETRIFRTEALALAWKAEIGRGNWDNYRDGALPDVAGEVWFELQADRGDASFSVTPCRLES